MVIATPNGDLRVAVQELTVEIAVLTERLEASKDALKVQASEYARRLMELNNAHERAERVLGTYVTRESFEQTIRELEGWRRAVDGDRASSSGRNSTYTSVIAIVFALAAVAAQVWGAIH